MGPVVAPAPAAVAVAVSDVNELEAVNVGTPTDGAPHAGATPTAVAASTPTAAITRAGTRRR